MRTGLEANELPHNETLESLLAKIDIRDSQWQIGHYEILEEIGRGGMGIIYRARQKFSRRIVALKCVLNLQSQTAEALARFRREAEAASSLDHPNILPIYEVGETQDGLPFFAMKLATGGSLRDARRALNRDPAQIMPLMLQVARAVHDAHFQGVLHRDLKPANILLDGRAQPMVSDFGLAKWIDMPTDLTQTLTIFGTPGYIAPEQALGISSRVGPAVDVYSLGAILFDLLAGRPPFLGDHALAVVSQAREKEAPRLRSLAPIVDRDVETICARCLERDPVARYASAKSLADDLERWLERKPILARPVSTPARAWRWARRNPALAISSIACLILAGVTLQKFVDRPAEKTSALNATAWQHSIAVLPFLDLDTTQPDPTWAAQAAKSLQGKMSILGPGRVVTVDQLPPHWTGAALQEEVNESARKHKTRTVLTGTRRQVGNKVRTSLHLVSENGTDMLGSWLVETEAGSQQSAVVVNDLATTIYQTLDSKEQPAGTIKDPVMLNERARKFFVGGRDLLNRRTIADLDNAIGCFEGAIEAAPQSVTARSYLAMACIGRNWLSADPILIERASRSAHEALELSPNDPTAHRGLCLLYLYIGDLNKAIEHGFRSLESGDQSERAFGQIAGAWRTLGRPDRAILWYEKAKASQRQPADYDALEGDCWADLCADDLAKHEYESAVSFHPDQPDGWMGLCRLEMLAGKIDNAREICRSHLSPYYSSFPPALQITAQVEFFARNFAEAHRLYSELAANDRSGGGKGDFYGAIDYSSALGRLSFEAGDKKTSHADLGNAIATETARLQSAPNYPVAFYRLAAAQASLGETRSALNSLRAAIDAGWIDFRSMRLDPRFDRISETPQFKNLLIELAAYVKRLERDTSVSNTAVTENLNQTQQSNEKLEIQKR